MRIANREIHFVACHQLPERSFHFRGKQFPVCARCTGIYLGYVFYPLFMLSIWYLNPTYTFMLIIPTFLDGMVQAFSRYESTNTIRFVTGLAAGIGLVSFMCITGTWLYNLIVNSF